jgi:hypothetical protein
MRVRKWRAWHVKEKKYYYFDFNSLSGSDDGNVSIDGFMFGVSIDDEELIFEDFIGLQDKNKKDVYEGDVVLSGGDVAEVTFEAPEYLALFSMKYDCYNLLVGDFEVIGNVHELTGGCLEELLSKNI